MQVGAVTKNSRDDGSVYAAVIDQEVHPDYNMDTEEFDFLVVKLGGWVSEPYLDTSLTASSNLIISPNLRFVPQKVQKEYVPLNNNTDYPPATSLMTVFGFGAIQEDGPSSTALLETDVFYLTPFLCSASYPEFFINHDVMMCANADDTDRYVLS
jgi:hypothetical protein